MKDYTLANDYPLTEGQNEIIEYMLQRPTAICGAQTGFGKTYCLSTALVYLLLRFPGTHAFVLAPPKALKGFKKELSTKLKIRYNIITSQEVQSLPGARITLVSTTCLDKACPEMVKMKSEGKKLIMLIDEYHCCQSPESKLYTRLKSVRSLFTIFWGATATPLKNDIEGLYWMMYMLNPSALGSWVAFRNRYLITERHTVKQRTKNGKYISRFVEEVIGFKDAEGLQRLLQQYIIIKQQPYNLNFTYNRIELEPAEVQKYLVAGKGLLRESSENNWAVRLHDLQQVIDNIQPDYRQEELTNKEKLFLAVLLKRIQEGCPCLVYCDYNEGINRLESLLKRFKTNLQLKSIYKVTGDIPLSDREKIEDKIKPNTVTLITSAGTESINLQRANTLIFYDVPFSILTFIQAVGRITRIDTKFSGQNIHIIESFGTIDTYKRLLIQINGNMIKSLFGNIETLPLELSVSDKNMIYKLKNTLLWAFKHNRLITEEELRKILGGN